MDLYDKINLLQNRQNQLSNEANLEQLKANEAELKKLRLQLKQEAEKKAKQPKCPHCGGGCEQGFDRCKNCSQEVIWCGHLVGKPGTMNELQQKLEQYKVAKLEKAERNKANKRNQRIQKQKQLERQKEEHTLWNQDISGVLMLGCGGIFAIGLLFFIIAFIAAAIRSG
ncbi:hypothetical protein OAO39_01245 [Pirellulaceae bacterium]|nr:hypothetical protein [Pirellulaceae bacterium]